jgi:hypothetical protein
MLENRNQTNRGSDACKRPLAAGGAGLFGGAGPGVCAVPIWTPGFLIVWQVPVVIVILGCTLGAILVDTLFYDRVG